MFIILCAKKKSISVAFLALATMEAAASAYLLYQEKQDWDENMVLEDYLADDFEDLDESLIHSDLRHGKDDDDMYDEAEITIQKDDSVSEEEFNDR
jgi:hypothetical protein